MELNSEVWLVTHSFNKKLRDLSEPVDSSNMQWSVTIDGANIDHTLTGSTEKFLYTSKHSKHTGIESLQ